MAISRVACRCWCRSGTVDGARRAAGHRARRTIQDPEAAMMNSQQLRGMFEHLRMCHGVTLRAIEAFPEEALDRQLIPDMRTPKQLAVHLYQMVVQGLTEGVARGE